ncbi:MAG: TIGR00282 family metallophosphoesterase [Leptospirales bacterium]|nr:TIGR00282 family metallophosphoesterase [Leptospirales bacterium]
MKEIRIFAIGDIVGKAGRNILASKLPGLIDREKIDIVIANGENSAGGMAMTPEVTRELFSRGIHVITSGNHIWNSNEILQIIDSDLNLLRPANYPPDVEGKGYCTINFKGINICVISLMGRILMSIIDCPFRKFDEIYEKVKNDSDIIVIDFHAEATSEKQALGWYVDGRASVLFGTHTHVQTADDRILPNGTGYITDIGMTGAFDSVIGMKIDKAVRYILTQTKAKFEVAEDNPGINGAIFTVTDSGKTVAIKRIRE